MRDILAVDVSPAMLEALHQRVGPASTLGNEAGVRTWLGDVAGLPAYQVCCGPRGSGPAHPEGWGCCAALPWTAGLLLSSPLLPSHLPLLNRVFLLSIHHPTPHPTTTPATHHPPPPWFAGTF